MEAYDHAVETDPLLTKVGSYPTVLRIGAPAK